MARSVRKKRKKKHIGLKIFLGLQLTLLIIAVGALAWYFAGGYATKVNALHKDAVSLVAASDKNTFQKNMTSIAYDASGNVLSVLRNGEDRYYISYNDIPEYAKTAVISTEDKKFYSHHGVDYKAIVRAVIAMLRNGRVTQGASTITQQLARNVFLTQDKTWERKIEEIYIATELEKKYSKNEILEFYLNNINFSNGYYGLEAAARGFFDKSVTDLDLSQIAFLLAIPNRPSYYDPVLHMDNTLMRRNLILKNMLNDGKISRETYDSAVGETITLKRPEGVHYDYPTTYITYCATRTLMKLDGFTFKYNFNKDKEREAYQKEYDEEYDKCSEQLYTGGYRIYTSISLDMQSALQNEIDTELAKSQEKSDKGIYKLQSAAVTIDNSTGMVRAIVGGRSQDQSGYTLNRAFQSYRQPGSSIKPLIVYTPALEGKYTPDSDLDDSPVENGPKNADGKFLGHMTLTKAVTMSRNTVAWKLFEEIGPKKGLSYLHEMEFSNILKSDEIPAASIGGLTKGVSVLEMTKAFAAIENDGCYRDPSCILKITRSDGKEIYEVDQKTKEIYKEKAAREMTGIMQKVVTEGTARGYSLANNMPSAGKTGTTNEAKDLWFVGYSPYYTTGVWLGYDTPTSMNGKGYNATALKIWKKYMDIIHAGLEPAEFPAPAADEDDAGNKTETNADTASETDNQPAEENENNQNSDAQKTQNNQAGQNGNTDINKAGGNNQPGNTTAGNNGTGTAGGNNETGNNAGNNAGTNAGSGNETTGGEENNTGENAAGGSSQNNNGTGN